MWMRMHALYKAAEMAMAAAGAGGGRAGDDGQLQYSTVVAVETGGADETS